MPRTKSLWPHVRVYPPAEVTSRNDAAEVDPREVGLTRANVDAIWTAMVRLYQTGLHPAAALCVRRHGKVLIDRAIGHTRGNAPGDPIDGPKVPVRHDTLFNLFSASKAVTAMLMHLLDERGILRLDDRVAEYIPEFGRCGKEGLTIRHVLVHRAGVPVMAGAKMAPALLANPQRVLELLCDARPFHVPGRRVAYHALTGGYILAEVIRRVTGRDVRQVLREEVREPLGLRAFDYGVPRERICEVAENAFTGVPPVPPLSWMVQRAIGLDLAEAATLTNDAVFLQAVVPSGNIVCTANEASRFFQLLLEGGELDGVRVFDRRTILRAVAEQSYNEFDAFLGLPIRYGTGFMLGRSTWSMYGPESSLAFGHLGFTCVLVYADPARAISVCLMSSGKPLVTPGQLRWLAVPRVIARQCPPLRA